jgi:hypothetical protein
MATLTDLTPARRAEPAQALAAALDIPAHERGARLARFRARI